jgi:peptide/nickel transport system substrate-binding protein
MRSSRWSVRRRSTLRTRALLGALALVATSLAAGCSSSGSSSGSGGGPGAAGGGPDAAASAVVQRSQVRPFQPAHRGGTLTLLATDGPGSLDPQVTRSGQFLQLFRGVYDGLVAFQQIDGDASMSLAPDLAQALPEPADGGKTYTFRLRSGVRFSTGREVTTDDVVASFRRIFAVAGPTARVLFGGIVGADRCLTAPADCTLARGLVADPASGTITFHLATPDPDFLAKLAVPRASVLPRQTPAVDQGSTPIPGTGAYRFQAYHPTTALVMVRNPYFTEWNRAAQPQGYPDIIEQRYGQSAAAAVADVQNGQADAVTDDLPADQLAGLRTRFPARLHVQPTTALEYLPINVHAAPFDNLKARQAVNWAIDRLAVARLLGGPDVAAPVCTVLPPDFPGHADNCQYTWPGGSTWRGPALDKARTLVLQSGTAGQQVRVVSADDELSAAVGRYVATTLGSIGWRATATTVPASDLPGVRGGADGVQISVAHWDQDYPAASALLPVLFGCAGPGTGSGAGTSANASGYCDPTVQSMMDQAQKVAVTDQTAADKLWGQADQAVMKAAAVAPLVTPKHVDFLGARVGDYQWSRQYRMIVSQLWVR